MEGLEVAVSVGNTAQEVHPYILHTDSTGTVNFTFSGLELAKNSDYFLVRVTICRIDFIFSFHFKVKVLLIHNLQDSRLSK